MFGIGSGPPVEFSGVGKNVLQQRRKDLDHLLDKSSRPAVFIDRRLVEQMIPENIWADSYLSPSTHQEAGSF